MPTLTDAELKEREEAAARTARAQLEAEVLKESTWKTLADLKESAVNADRRIGQSVQKEKEVTEKLKTVEQKLEEVTKGKGSSGQDGAQAGGKGDDDLAARDPAAYLRTLTDTEEKALDEMVKADPTLGSRIVSGGEKAMAQALAALRKIAPPASAAAAGSPFASYRKNSAGTGAVPLEEAIAEAHKKYTQRHRSPASGARGAPAGGAAPVSDDGAPPPKRATGGMSIFRGDGGGDGGEE